ncbi:Reticulon-domain-containing protein [Bisporella sp. PMI_857]|nr:Reticulon-domain-containing protein [Bisporella sp. PMI_857]
MSDSFDTGVVPSIEKDTNTSALSLDSAKNTAVNTANAVQNHPITQNITNGPVATNVKDQTAKTQSELSSLAASRTTPGAPAATGQQLTHYHSFFTRLLSWEHPRASGIAFASVVAFIFAARYLNILRYGLKLTSWTLGATVLAEAAGKAAFGKGLITQIRPRKYYTIPKDSIDRLTGDITELINFFVIESQRIIFAENVFASAAAFLGAFISYYLIKIVPFWGLTLLSTSLVFLTPLIYKTNKEVIDAQIANVSSIVNQQTEQVKQLASHHAARATETTKAYASDYSAKAQEIIGNARGRSSSPSVEKKKPAYKSEDFPAAPKEGFKSESLHENEPLIST